MAFKSFLTIFLLLCGNVYSRNVAWVWYLDNPPATGYNTVEFPMNVRNAPHEINWYFAQQFGFFGSDANDIGYIGLQPQPDKNNKTYIRGVFSSFIANTTTSDSNCHQGADGGPGVSCGYVAELPYDAGYTMEVLNIGNTTWQGTIVDKDRKIRVHIGTWRLPAQFTGIRGYQAGFVEYYTHDSEYPCNQTPYSEVIIGFPATPNPHGHVDIGTPYDYGNCKGQFNFSARNGSSDWTIHVGYKNATLG